MTNKYCFIILICFLLNKGFGKICIEAYDNQPASNTLNNDVSNELESNISEKSNDFRKIIDIFEMIKCNSDENLHLKKTPEENLIPDMRLCKEMSVSRMLAQTYSMDSDNFKHVTLKRNTSGQLTYFEMHIVIEKNERVDIQLMEKENIWDSDIRYYIDVGRKNNQYTELQYQSNTLRRIHTPDILSLNQLGSFYIKIDDGKLEFGKEGSSSPLISYYDARFRFVNYFTFGTWGNEAKVRYDCPAPVEGSRCKELSLSGWSLPFSMNDTTFNHVTVKRNSTSLTYFEMHIAIEAKTLRVSLTSKESVGNPGLRYDIDVGFYSNQHTRLDVFYQGSWAHGVKLVQTLNLLSSNQFTAFYIKIEDGTLKIGKEGDSNPFFSYHDAKLGLLNYFFFLNTGGSQNANIRYDCPAPVEGTVEGSSRKIF